MLIVIPTYKRNNSLKWVLESLVQCRTDEIPEEINILVVNNYPPAANDITSIVGNYLKYTKFSWSILYREKTLLAVDNWYSAIFDNAKDDEIVFINSDDDIFTPNSLVMRYKEMMKTNAGLLLSKVETTIYFTSNCERALCTKILKPILPTESYQIDFKDLYLFSPQHLSNHCYRNTKELKVYFEHAMNWCNELYWLDRNNRIINFPLFLTFVFCLRRAKIYALPVPLILRGQDVEEIEQSKYGVPGWNHGFIHLSGLFVMNNKDLCDVSELEEWRNDYISTYIKWFPTYIFDSRLSWKMIKNMQKMAKLKWSKLFSTSIIKGCVIVALDSFGLIGYRLKNKIKIDGTETSSLINLIGKQASN